MGTGSRENFHLRRPLISNADGLCEDHSLLNWFLELYRWIGCAIPEKNFFSNFETQKLIFSWEILDILSNRKEKFLFVVRIGNNFTLGF